MITNLKVELDKSVKDNILFQKINSLKVSKTQIFKYGIHKEEVPDFITEDSFEYLESKIPALADLNEIWIELEKNRILNLAKDEKARDISEIIGVGVGLLYSTKLLSVNPNRISKILHPKKKQKILDFSIMSKNVNYDIETKGTVIVGNIKTMKDDIVKKKKGNPNKNTKIGTITLSRKKTNTQNSKIIVMDDFNNKPQNHEFGILDFLQNYLWILSFILDSSYYNRLVNNIKNNKFGEFIIPKDKIGKEYLHNGIKYIGYYFDKRLILEKIKNFAETSRNISELFRSISNNIGREKYFLGLDEKIINLLNKKDLQNLIDYESKQEIFEKNNHYLFLDSDGVLIVKSKGKADKQIENNFPEKEVKERLGLEYEFIRGYPHKCGAPCRSREIEGKPCEILTFRENCHFHR